MFSSVRIIFIIVTLLQFGCNNENLLVTALYPSNTDDMMYFHNLDELMTTTRTRSYHETFDRKLTNVNISDVCDGFGPKTDNNFFQNFTCNCNQNDTIITGSCHHKEICIQYVEEELNETLYYNNSNNNETTTFMGLYTVLTSVNFITNETLSNLTNDDIVDALFHGSYLNCFEYDTNLYNGSKVCMFDTNDHDDNNNSNTNNSNCTVDINDEYCESCTICGKGNVGPLFSFNCSNILGGNESRNLCNDESLAGSILRFLDANNDLCMDINSSDFNETISSSSSSNSRTSGSNSNIRFQTSKGVFLFSIGGIVLSLFLFY